jgi:hypothetical protein
MRLCGKSCRRLSPKFTPCRRTGPGESPISDSLRVTWRCRLTAPDHPLSQSSRARRIWRSTGVWIVGSQGRSHYSTGRSPHKGGNGHQGRLAEAGWECRQRHGYPPARSSAQYAFHVTRGAALSARMACRGLIGWRPGICNVADCSISLPSFEVREVRPNGRRH